MKVMASSLHLSHLACSTCRLHADKTRIPVRVRQGPAMKAKWPFALVLGVAVLLHPERDYSNDLALAFNSFRNSSSSIQKDPVDPFTLHDNIFKKYFIENIVEGKVVSRRKGFTSTACLNTLDANKETPERVSRLKTKRLDAGARHLLVNHRNFFLCGSALCVVFVFVFPLGTALGADFVRMIQ
ncbi:hypothetical protein GOP47_0012278 [Adiantum capillus-veneris]|uniref:Uncharacterized protein n=1 Tax=Adiantum capillus-veneris TaxID=13818 RepID=A0A9D4ZFI7_ADICA|nr:hypothetical protein GOP47_0012278 [Adiantum capillus-veneris]